MGRIHIEKLKENIGKVVKIAGFVQIIRDQGGIKFLIIRDATGIVQVVVKKNTDAMKPAESLSHESVVEIFGFLKEEKQAPGGFEVVADKIEVLSHADPELPIPVFEKGQEETDQSIRMDWRWIDLRKPKNILIFKIWTSMEAAFREYWFSHNYIEIHSPKLIGTASESGAEVFEVKYFDRTAYLAQSPQFYKQMAMAAGFEKVFEVGPVFRAEPSFTSRHATEFVGYDLEMSYIKSHDEVMAEEEKLLEHVIGAIKKRHGEEIKETFGLEVNVPKIPFPKLTMAEAKKILKDLKIESKGEDLSSEEEKKISEYVKEKNKHDFVFITDYPASVRPFYHMRDEKDSMLTKSFDLLWGGLEVTTGAQREHRYDILLSQAKEKKMKIEAIQFYLNFFKYGCPPHGGIGMGPARMMMQLLGLDNVREVMFLYRGVKRLEP
ncbi:aspartate--tRNA(Asn) ligase [Candidatus Giovannonibacteria bacterium RIFCSPLOWO2_02_FULL_45_14]|uniref:Aspartate--tRNA(Asp/Asn) ligase n=1 Tax=Candidatus Giovannonibacteria bacterium RIFCSPLOWO2_12_FULL_44_15 TaxID=1798364 RepID=A0A1F5XZJ7_9BACT|nr:MAG: aspartate--tRNA(Asn) ligase [Candidatus Giovannonibacteria bacterium RIFCSPHIGHO2_02_FULL_44_31]OGF75953.1 MAG: aspartate--tRNA(Asn) ligase [Candidatus Giovannonibacteria bacterium RIFCSPHIGHO2_12_FULL_44_29]OGF91013.1 MAG: aspartate--tRNA(Asn) ligase [Candidatus Giovannonibacteria bacterium RIFCSPLOWO2_02_FULL_45_14]OGF93289.1 MAG: aspartate--tRNA(Asn) ligase [Candidatus Giovannonibacteria bacterium RIFCSPLOWO2_12_FULL_44_15]